MLSHTGIFTFLFLCSFCCHGKVGVPLPDDESKETKETESTSPDGGATYDNSPSDLAQSQELKDNESSQSKKEEITKEEESSPEKDQSHENENADIQKQEASDGETPSGLNVDGDDVVKEALEGVEKKQEEKGGHEDTDRKEKSQSEPVKETADEEVTLSDAASNEDDKGEVQDTGEKASQGRFKIKKSAKEVRDFQEKLEREEKEKIKKRNNEKKKKKKKKRRKRDEYFDPDDVVEEPKRRKKNKQRDSKEDDLEDVPRKRKKPRMDEEADYSDEYDPSFNDYDFDGSDDYDNEVEPEMFPEYKYSRRSNGRKDEDGDHPEDMYSRPKKKRRFSDESWSPEEEDDSSHRNFYGGKYDDLEPEADTHEQVRDDKKFKRGQRRGKDRFEKDEQFDNSGSKTRKGEEYDTNNDEEFRFAERGDHVNYGDDFDLGKGSARSSRMRSGREKEPVGSERGKDQEEAETPNEPHSFRDDKEHFGDTKDYARRNGEDRDSAVPSGSKIGDEYYEDAKEYIKQKRGRGKEAAEAPKTKRTGGEGMKKYTGQASEKNSDPIGPSGESDSSKLYEEAEQYAREGKDYLTPGQDSSRLREDASNLHVKEERKMET